MSDIKLNEEFDWGFSAFDEDEVVETHKYLDEADKVRAMYELIMPLINNLLKDSDKPIIKWPNRRPKLEEFKKKLEALLHGEET